MIIGSIPTCGIQKLPKFTYSVEKQPKTSIAFPQKFDAVNGSMAEGAGRCVRYQLGL